jgi:hypothetical protein
MKTCRKHVRPHLLITGYAVWSVTNLIDEVQVIDVLLFHRNYLADNSRYFKLVVDLIRGKGRTFAD